MFPAWLEEVDLGVGRPWPRMGTRSLRDLPWLVVDEKRDDELLLRSQLLTDRPAEVLAEPAVAAEAALELEAMVIASGAKVIEGRSPLERLGRSVQEDFCLLRRGPREWELEAAVLCFPSRWRLAAKIGRPLSEVHAPTPGYSERLAQPITTTFDRLGERSVIRRNWFLHPDASLFQPDRPVDGDPVVESSSCGRDLWVRSERQTLRRLPDSGWIVFTIRVQQCRFEELRLARPTDFSEWLATADPVQKLNIGVSPEQELELRSCLEKP